MERSDLGLLVALDALLQEASVTKAAKRVGLSTPAMSHALARIRERLGDEILVRSGRSMVLTPRAEALRPRVRSVVADATEVLAPEPPASTGELIRTFVVSASDHVLAVLGAPLDELLRKDAPNVSLRFVANHTDDGEALREGRMDLAVGAYRNLPPEIRTRHLLTDPLVCVVREDHPKLRRGLSLEQFLAVKHLQVAPRGRPGGFIDDALREHQLERSVVRVVPFYLSALLLVAETDYLLTVPEGVARTLAPWLRLRILEPPIPLQPFSLWLAWHPRFSDDPGHRWLRGAFVRAVRGGAKRRAKAKR